MTTKLKYLKQFFDSLWDGDYIEFFKKPIATDISHKSLRYRISTDTEYNNGSEIILKDNIRIINGVTIVVDNLYSNGFAPIKSIPYLKQISNSYDSDSLSYFNELPIQPTSEYKNVINSTIISLKQSANFSKIDRLTLYCSEQRENAVISLVNPTSTPSEEVGGVSWVAFNGYKGGDNTKHIDSHYNPVSDGVNYTQNSSCFFIWSKENVSDTGVDGGIQIGETGSGAFVFSNISGTLYASMNDNVAGGITIPISGAGLTTIVRTTSTIVQVWHNGVKLIETTVASTALQNFNFWWLALNRENVSAFPSARELAFTGNASGDLDQVSFYNTMQEHMTAIDLLPIPPAPPDPGISDVVAKIHFPSLLDVSGNDYHSILGDSLPGGITAPLQSGGKTIFNGLQSIKLNDNLPITVLKNHTQFFNIYCESPEETQNFLNLGTIYRMGSCVFVETIAGPLKRSMVGGVYLDENATTEPVYGKSLPKLQLGNNTIGISFSGTDVIIFINGIISKITSNNAYPATGLSGWFGAWVGSAANNFTLPAYYSINDNEHLWIYDYSATAVEMQVKGNAMMREAGVSLVVFEGDSITLGYGVTTNANNWPSVVTQYLIDNTDKKWASLNIGVGGRTLAAAAAACDQNNYSISGNGISPCVINVIAPAQGEGVLNVYNVMMGINEIANGATLGALQTSLTTLITFRNNQGFDCYVYSITPAAELDGSEESVRLAFNAWLPTVANTLGFTFVNVCANTNLNSQASSANTTYFTDGIHLTDLTCTSIIGPMGGAAIVADI